MCVSLVQAADGLRHLHATFFQIVLVDENVIQEATAELCPADVFEAVPEV